jgi:hypothetical protein
MNDDYDTPWKEVVTDHFPEFMAFYFPLAHAAIDWSRPHDFLDQELAALSRDAELGKRLLDKLVRVYLRDGEEQWVLVHLEVQGWRDADFAERILPVTTACMTIIAGLSSAWRCWRTAASIGDHPSSATGCWAARYNWIFRWLNCRITPVTSMPCSAIRIPSRW